MEQRTCPACGEQFTPTTKTQRACPPTTEDRERAATAVRQPRSRCARKLYNATQKGRPVVVGKVGEPFDCAQCDQPCTPGVNVAPHATKFCGETCKATWHTQHEDGANRRWAEQQQHERVVDRLLACPPPVFRIDVANSRRSLRLDPCSYCGEPAQASDHIVPRSHGGSDDWDNRTGACHRCNNHKMQTSLLVFMAWRMARDDFEPWRQIVADIHTRQAA